MENLVNQLMQIRFILILALKSYISPKLIPNLNYIIKAE